MRSALVGIFVVHVLLMALTPAGLVEAFRIPALSDHYAQHLHESGGTMTWTSFLLLHYTDPGHEKRDGQRHAHLPLHRISGSAVVYTVDPPLIFVPRRSCVAHTYGSVPVRIPATGSGPLVFHPPKCIG